MLYGTVEISVADLDCCGSWLLWIYIWGLSFNFDAFQAQSIPVPVPVAFIVNLDQNKDMLIWWNPDQTKEMQIRWNPDPNSYQTKKTSNADTTEPDRDRQHWLKKCFGITKCCLVMKDPDPTQIKIMIPIWNKKLWLQIHRILIQWAHWSHAGRHHASSPQLRVLPVDWRMCCDPAPPPPSQLFESSRCLCRVRP